MLKEENYRSPFLTSVGLLGNSKREKKAVASPFSFFLLAHFRRLIFGPGRGRRKRERGKVKEKGGGGEDQLPSLRKFNTAINFSQRKKKKKNNRGNGRKFHPCEISVSIYFVPFSRYFQFSNFRGFELIF